MKLSDFLQDIALGDLAGSPVVELGGYEIIPAQLPRVIQAINQALDYLHSTFPIKENQVVIQLHDSISRYYLDSDYAYSNQNKENIKYILDTLHNPFIDDVLAIESVFADNGIELTVNDNFSYTGIFTPEYNCVQTTNGTHQYKQLTVVYKAKHKRIPLNEPMNSKLTINIPAAYNSALQSYVASLIYHSMSGTEYAELGNFYYGRFKTLVEELKSQGVGYKSTLGLNIKPIIRNWL